MMSFG